MSFLWLIGRDDRVISFVLKLFFILYLLNLLAKAQKTLRRTIQWMLTRLQAKPCKSWRETSTWPHRCPKPRSTVSHSPNYTTRRLWRPRCPNTALWNRSSYSWTWATRIRRVTSAATRQNRRLSTIRRQTRGLKTQNHSASSRHHRLRPKPFSTVHTWETSCRRTRSQPRPLTPPLIRLKPTFSWTIITTIWKVRIRTPQFLWTTPVQAWVMQKINSKIINAYAWALLVEKIVFFTKKARWPE